VAPRASFLQRMGHPLVHVYCTLVSVLQYWIDNSIIEVKSDKAYREETD
jgi:hypothetical protein